MCETPVTRTIKQRTPQMRTSSTRVTESSGRWRDRVSLSSENDPYGFESPEPARHVATRDPHRDKSVGNPVHPQEDAHHRRLNVAPRIPANSPVAKPTHQLRRDSRSIACVHARLIESAPVVQGHRTGVCHLSEVRLPSASNRPYGQACGPMRSRHAAYCTTD